MHRCGRHHAHTGFRLPGRRVFREWESGVVAFLAELGSQLLVNSPGSSGLPLPAVEDPRYGFVPGNVSKYEEIWSRVPLT